MAQHGQRPGGGREELGFLKAREGKGDSDRGYICFLQSSSFVTKSTGVGQSQAPQEEDEIHGRKREGSLTLQPLPTVRSSSHYSMASNMPGTVCATIPAAIFLKRQ